MARSYPDRVTPGSVMKGAHVRVLRQYIDEDLAAASSSYPWSWATWTAAQDAQQPVRAVFFTEMRAAIQRLWDTKSRGPLPNWTQEAPQPPSGSQTGSLVRATHVTDLRAWLNQYENNHSPLRQGVTTFAYDPSAPDGPIISKVAGNDWSADAQSLSGPVPVVRVNITGQRDDIHSGHTKDFLPPSSNHVGDYRLYRFAFKQYVDRGMSVIPVFPADFYNPFPRRDFASADYQLEFATRVKEFVTRMRDYSGDPITDRSIELTQLIIWNEPNNSAGTPLSPADFVRLIYRVWKRFKDDPFYATAMPEIYAGGLLLGTSPPGDPNNVAFIDTFVNWVRDCEQFLVDSRLMEAESTATPWTALTMHVYHSRGLMPGSQTETRIHRVLRRMRDAQREWGDPTGIIVGEWGINRLDADGPNKLSLLSGELHQGSYEPEERVLPELMLYYTHQAWFERDVGHWGFRFFDFDFFHQQFQHPSLLMRLLRYTVNAYDSSTESQRAKALRNRYATIFHGQVIP